MQRVGDFDLEVMMLPAPRLRISFASGGGAMASPVSVEDLSLAIKYLEAVRKLMEVKKS